MALSPEEKERRTRARMLETAMQYSTGTFISRFVAPVFQKMIRAEAAAQPDSLEETVINGSIGLMMRKRGQCVCVTCGRVGPWSGGLESIRDEVARIRRG